MTAHDDRVSKSIKVSVKLFANFRKIINKKEIGLELKEGATIFTLLEILINTYPRLRDEIFDENNELRNWIKILKNGRNITFLNGLKTDLNYGDEVAVFPPLAGGEGVSFPLK